MYRAAIQKSLKIIVKQAQTNNDCNVALSHWLGAITWMVYLHHVAR